MTNTIILHWWWEKSWISFLDTTDNKANILIMYHAKEDIQERSSKFHEDCTFFHTIWIHRSILHQWSEHIATLLQQIEDANIIIIKWWNSEIICDRLQWHEESISEKLQHKTIIAISAWAYWLAQEYYSNDRKAVFSWSWIVKANIICHYSENIPLQTIRFSNDDLPHYYIKEWVSITLLNNIYVSNSS
jgi:hypothetical protein